MAKTVYNNSSLSFWKNTRRYDTTGQKWLRSNKFIICFVWAILKYTWNWENIAILGQNCGMLFQRNRLNSSYVVGNINVCKTLLPEYSTMLFRLDFSSWATQDVSMFMETPRGCSCFDCIAMLLLCFFFSLRFILPFVSAPTIERQPLSSHLSYFVLNQRHLA